MHRYLILDACTEIKAHPARTALKPSPARGRAYAGFDFHDSVHTHGNKLRPVIVRSRSFADVEVCDGDANEERNIRRDGSSCFRCVDVYTVYIEHTISRISIRAFLGVLKDFIRTFLRFGILPCLTDAVPGNSRLVFLHIVLREVPPLDDRAEVLHVSKARGIAAILDDLRSLLVVSATLQTVIAEFAAVLRAEEVCAVVCNGILHARVLAEVCCDGFIAAVRVLFLCLLGVLALAVPGRAAPGVAGEGAFHAEHVIGVLCQFRFAVAGFEDELRHRNRCEDNSLIISPQTVSNTQCPPVRNERTEVRRRCPTAYTRQSQREDFSAT